MATYQISFFALAPAGATGGTAALDRMGLRFVIAAPGTGALLVEAGTGGAGAGGAGTGGARVARGSPQGRAGQSVTLGPGIVVSTQGDPRQTLRFDVLELDGVPVGLIGAEAPAAGVGLVVTGIEAPGDQPRPLDLAAVGLPVSQGGRPRKSLLSFTHGTRIDTPDGPRPVEALAAGDLVTTLDNGSQPVRWTGRRWVSSAEMALREDLRPVILDSGALGNAVPLLVSPRHRILLNDWRAQVYFGEDQVLVPIQALINGATVRQILPEGGVTYFHLLFDRHEVIVAEGVLSESLHPGEGGLGALEPAQRQEIEAIYPDRALERRRAAFPMLRMAEARALRLPG